MTLQDALLDISALTTPRKCTVEQKLTLRDGQVVTVYFIYVLPLATESICPAMGVGDSIEKALQDCKDEFILQEKP